MNDEHHLITTIATSQYKPITTRCLHCGSATVKQWHHFGPTFVSAFLKLAAAVRSYGRPVSRDELTGVGMTYSEHGNLATIKHWGITKSDDGRWTLTEKGWKVLDGRFQLPARVLTLKTPTEKAHAIGVSPELVSLQSLAKTETWNKYAYLTHRLPATPEDVEQLSQPRLLEVAPAHH